MRFLLRACCVAALPLAAVVLLALALQDRRWCPPRAADGGDIERVSRPSGAGPRATAEADCARWRSRRRISRSRRTCWPDRSAAARRAWRCGPERQRCSEPGGAAQSLRPLRQHRGGVREAGGAGTGPPEDWPLPLPASPPICFWERRCADSRHRRQATGRPDRRVGALRRRHADRNLSMVRRGRRAGSRVARHAAGQERLHAYRRGWPTSSRRRRSLSMASLLPPLFGLAAERAPAPTRCRRTRRDRGAGAVRHRQPLQRIVAAAAAWRAPARRTVTLAARGLPQHFLVSAPSAEAGSRWPMRSACIRRSTTRAAAAASRSSTSAPIAPARGSASWRRVASARTADGAHARRGAAESDFMPGCPTCRVHARG